MRRRHRLVLVACLAFAGLPAGEASAQDRYTLAGGCYALKSVATGKFVAKTAGGGYRASAGAAGAAEPFRMQATALGRYLLYGAERDLMAVGKASPAPVPVPIPGAPLPVPGLPVAATAAADDRVQSAAAPSDAADWRVDGAGDDFAITLPAAGGQALAVDAGGTLVLRDRSARFAFASRSGCPAYPEIALGVSGDPSRGASSWGEVRGLIDAHMHMMAFEFLGGRIHCGERAECTAAQIDRRLDEVYDMGVRDMELVNKFDNALGGVAGDAAETGAVTNNGNRIETGKYWQMQSCDGHDHAHDRTQLTAPGVERDSLAGNVLRVFGPTGVAPVYPPAPHCNVRGLSELGAHLVRRMIAKRMIVDPDHLSVRARRQVLDIVEAARYSGIISSHSWSTPDSIPRIYRLGGFVTPYAGAATDFVTQWREALPVRDRRFYQGVGWGADMNGFGAQGPPRNGPSPVTYPFKSWDGKVTIDKQHSGQRVYDINVDGVAHYGLYPDWVEDLRHLAGQEIIDDLGRGAEAYLQMWERADGIATGCRPSRARLTRRGAGARGRGDTAWTRGSSPWR